MILSTTNSPLKNKKYRAYINDGQYIDFGLKDSSTYLDHINVKIIGNGIWEIKWKII